MESGGDSETVELGEEEVKQEESDEEDDDDECGEALTEADADLRNSCSWSNP